MSKSFGKIFGTNVTSINKNNANIVPYTRNDGSIGYYLTDSNGNVVYDSKQKNYFRNVQQNIEQQSIKPYDNYMSSQERIENIKQGNNLFIDIENNPDANYEMPWYTIKKHGQDNVNENLDIIEKYAQQYNIDPNLVKAIMYNEDATGHKFVLNDLADYLHISSSQMPMNIQGKTWGNFKNTQYDTYNPEQNIKLGVQVIKQLQNSIHNPTPDKVGTMWNDTGAMEINDFGARTKTIYDNKPWEK